MNYSIRHPQNPSPIIEVSKCHGRRFRIFNTESLKSKAWLRHLPLMGRWVWASGCRVPCCRGSLLSRNLLLHCSSFWRLPFAIHRQTPNCSASLNPKLKPETIDKLQTVELPAQVRLWDSHSEGFRCFPFRGCGFLVLCVNLQRCDSSKRSLRRYMTIQTIHD